MVAEISADAVPADRNITLVPLVAVTTIGPTPAAVRSRSAAVAAVSEIVPVRFAERTQFADVEPASVIVSDALVVISADATVDAVIAKTADAVIPRTRLLPPAAETVIAAAPSNS